MRQDERKQSLREAAHFQMTESFDSRLVQEGGRLFSCFAICFGNFRLKIQMLPRDYSVSLVGSACLSRWIAS